MLARFREHLPHLKFKLDFTSFSESQCQDLDNIYTVLTLNESSSSKNAPGEFFQASQNDGTPFANSIQNNAKNEIRSSAENSSYENFEDIPNKSRGVFRTQWNIF